METINKFLDKIDIRSQWKVFVINLVVIFTMVTLQHMHINPPKVYSKAASMVSSWGTTTKLNNLFTGSSK